MPDIVKLHKLIDQWAEEERQAEEAKVAGAVAAPNAASTDPNATPPVAEAVADKAPTMNDKNQHVVRTKTSGDRVYLIDETHKTRQWITTPEILAALGFNIAEVTDMEEQEFLKYTMTPPIHKIPDADS